MPEVHYEVRDRVAEITIDRPPVNALSLELIEGVIAAFRRAGADDSARAVLLTSANEKVFCAGLDLDIVKGKPGRDMRRFLERLYVEYSDVQYRLGKPSIAAVAGAARAGGMTLAVSCDMIIAGERATFGYPEIDVGLIPAIHFVLLPKLIGRHRAFELLFGGKPFNAARAEALGLINRVVPSAEVLETARSLAREMASKAPSVMRLGRNAFHRANALDLHRSIEDVADALAATVELPESQEGLAAFVEKRPPVW
jgi:enoyl-CoA hydratase/carnithine racemase